MLKKYLGILFALVLVLSFSLVTAVPAAAASLTVDTSVADTPPNYHTIQAAITAASPGDTIIVAEGVYDEQVFINESLTLAGAGAETTTIKAPAVMTTVTVEGHLFQGVVNVIGATAHSITVDISGFTIDGDRQAPAESSIWFAGIVYSNADGTIADNVITKVRQQTFGVDAASWKGMGIWICDDSTVTVDDNSFSEWQRNAIYVHLSDATATITNNVITGMDTSPSVCNGIVFQGATDGTVSGNTITGCIYTEPGSSGNDFYGDIWQACGITFHEGYGTFTVDNNIVTGNDMGIYSRLLGDGKAFITNNTVKDNLYFGIVFRKGDVEATGNTISGSEVGILVPSSGPKPPSDPVANYNNIIGNSVYGIRNDTSTEIGPFCPAPAGVWGVDATNNWWGTTDATAITAMVSGAVDTSSPLVGPYQQTVVSLTATSEEAAIGISVSPTFIQFGAITSGTVVSGPALTVSNVGNVLINVDAELTNDTFFNDPGSFYFYTAALRLGGCPSDQAPSPTTLGTWTLTGGDKPFGDQPFWVGESRPLTTGLDCPPVIKAGITYTGTVVFWAEPLP